MTTLVKKTFETVEDGITNLIAAATYDYCDGPLGNNETMKKEYPDSKQRVAVCYSKWRQSKGTTEIDFTEQIRQLKADEKAGYPPNCNKGYEEKDGKCVLIKKDKDSTAKG